MTPAVEVLRTDFLACMPGLAVFDELAAKHDQLLADLANLERRWRASVPANLVELEAERTDYKQALLTIVADPTASAEVKATATAALRKWARP